MEQSPTLPNITTSMKSRYPSGQQDWENYRAEIEDLYRRDGLENVRQYMEQRYNFKATYATNALYNSQTIRLYGLPALF